MTRTIFNSLGSNFGANVAMASFNQPSPHARAQLVAFLETRYSGKVTLTYKGRDALALALTAIKQHGQKRQVVVTAFTCFTVYQAIRTAGLTPVYLDIAPGNLNFSSQDLASCLSKNHEVGAVIIQNTLGFPVDMVAISRICQQAKVALIEDLAHSIGAVYDAGHEAGMVGDFTILSFSQDKVVDGVSGGAVIVRNEVYDNSVLSPRSRLPLPPGLYWRDRLYPFFTTIIRKTYPVGLGKVIHKLLKALNWLPRPVGQRSYIDYELPSWHCQLILRQFQMLAQTMQHRRKLAKIYAQRLDPHFLIPQPTNQIEQAACLRFPIWVNGRDRLVNALRKNGFYLSDIWYDAPIAPRKYLAKTDYRNGQCPQAEAMAEHIFNLPTHQNISVEQAKKLVTLVNHHANE
ncbi:MAG: DegT/DnrJ/EryC1/StrS family aminotransferase [Patescibacteria group bacterium]|nr:DegT/DnrJ/EryC1/StrS family aminotransferase [Patescibacteria group bacterium]